MKKILLKITVFAFMASYANMFSQTGRVGINTTTPTSSLDVNGKKDASGNLLATDITGLQAPRMTRAELTNKGNTLYTVQQIGTLIYITDVSGGDALATSQRKNITSAGYYFFDGNLWQPVASATGGGGSYTGSTSVTLNGSSFERAALTGDVTATANSNATTVTQIQGKPISNTAPLANQVLKWNGSQWAPAADATGSGSGDNLGNHSATQDLVINNNLIRLRDAADSNHGLKYDSGKDGPKLFGFGGGILGTSGGTTLEWFNNGDVNIEGKLRIKGGSPGAGKVLTSDANGLASWTTPSGGGDNLGNHSATQILAMNGNDIRLKAANDGNHGLGTVSSPKDGPRLWGNTGGVLGAANGNNALVWDDSKNVEIQGQIKILGGSPGAGKVLTSDGSGLATWTTPSGGGGDNLGNHSATQTLAMNDNEIRLRGSSDGNHGIRYISGIDGVSIYGNGGGELKSGGASVMKWDNNGIRTNKVTALSDMRFKKDIQPIPNATQMLNKLHGYTYTWKDRKDFPGQILGTGKDAGVLAQEVEKVLPQAVQTNAEGYKSVNYNALIPVLIEALKESNERIKVLEKKLELINAAK